MVYEREGGTIREREKLRNMKHGAKASMKDQWRVPCREIQKHES